MRSLTHSFNLKRRGHLGALAALVASAALPHSAAATAAPRRLISVGGALTEIIYALQAERELIGVDTTSLYPAATQKLPNVGYARTLSAEGVLALSPTQVIATEDAGPPAVIRQISAAGIPVTVLAANHRFEGLLDRVQRIGELTARSTQAAALITQLRSDWLKAQTARQTMQTRRGKTPLRVLFILAHSPSQIMVGGQDTSADAMITYAGAHNALQGFSGYKPLTPEAAIAANPDVILLTTQGLAANGGIDGVLRMSGIAQTAAGSARRIYALEGMYMLGFGPRMPLAVSELTALFDKGPA